jgi:hypothetical protein
MAGDAVQSLVTRPQCRSPGQSNRGEQMDIDVPDSAPEQRVPVDEMQNFRIGGDAKLGQVRQRTQDKRALTQIAQGKFTNYEGVRKNRSGFEQPDERPVARA